MSKVFRFSLTFLKDNVVIALLFATFVFSNFDNIFARFFVDKAHLEATGSFQYMELGPVAMSEYEDLAAEFKTDTILENWNKRSNLEKSTIPERKDVEMFSEYAAFYFPENDTVRRYAKSARYQIIIENTGNLVAEDIYLISTYRAESAVVERATGADFSSPQYETLEHDGRRVSLGKLFPSEKMEINVWHGSSIYPSVLSLTSADGKIDIRQEVKIKSKQEALMALVSLALVVLFLNWIFRELMNIVISATKKAWKKYNEPDDSAADEETSASN